MSSPSSSHSRGSHSHSNIPLMPLPSIHVDHDPPSRSSSFSSHPTTDSPDSTGELSGLYFGILNIYTTLPQFVATFISMLVFSILEPGKSPELAHDAHPSEHHGTDGPNAIAICLLIGAVSTVGAAYATKKLKDLQ